MVLCDTFVSFIMTLSKRSYLNSESSGFIDMNKDKIPAENDVVKSCLTGLQKVSQIFIM